MKKRKEQRQSPCSEVMLLAVQLASAAIYMQPRFKETDLFRRFAESRAGKLLQGKSSRIDKALAEVHGELLQSGMVALTDEARHAIAKDGKIVAKAALKAYLDTVEQSIPAELRAEWLSRHPEYQKARSLYESMS